MPKQFLEGFEPPSRDTRIWRYLDTHKYESLIESSSVYFAATHQFADKFEGSLTVADYERRLAVLSPGIQSLERSGKFISKAFEGLRRLHKISCWHMNASESAAMWSLYSHEGRGIAIQSSITRLNDALEPFRIKPEYTEEEIWLGAVRYADYKSYRFTGTGFLPPFFHKRLSYAHEQEFRAVLTLRLADMFGVKIPNDGVCVPVNLTTLCEAVYVAPGMDTDYRKLVRAILDRNNLTDIPVHQSELDDEALY
jgi:hypothetical protein